MAQVMADGFRAVNAVAVQADYCGYLTGVYQLMQVMSMLLSARVNVLKRKNSTMTTSSASSPGGASSLSGEGEVDPVLERTVKGSKLMLQQRGSATSACHAMIWGSGPDSLMNDDRMDAVHLKSA